MARRFGLIAGVIVALAPAVARAQDEPHPRYGNETLAADGAGLAVGLAAVPLTAHWRSTLAYPASPGAVVAIGWYGVGGVGAASVHFAHGQLRMGLVDLAIRSTLPTGTGLLGLLANCAPHGHFDGDCSKDGMTGGVLAGQAAAAAIDALFLAEERHDTTADRQGREWYGWQTMLVDAGGILAGGVAAALAPSTLSGAQERLAFFGLGWYLVSAIGAPTVHFVRGNASRGFQDAVMRLGMPVLGAVPGLLAYCSATALQQDCDVPGSVGGFTAFVAAAGIIDATMIAYDRAENFVIVNPAGLVPIVRPVPGGGVAGVGGAF